MNLSPFTFAFYGYRNTYRMDFEKILNNELRWPRKGDKPFKRSDNWNQNANISQDKNISLAAMICGYKQAADLMVEKSKESTFDRNCLVFPIIFNYRHFIELSIKTQISMFGPDIGIKANWSSHDLAFLWSEFLHILEEYNVDNGNGADRIVGKIILEFAKIDPKSMSFRYPVDNKGMPISVTQKEIDLEALADVMEGVDGFFIGCDGYFSALGREEP